MNRHKCELRQDSISHLPKNVPNSSCWTHFKRAFLKLFLVSINHPQVFVFLKSNAAVEKESKRQVDLQSGFIIHPLSEFRKVWDILIFLVMFLHQLMTAWTIGFFADFEASTMELLVAVDFTFSFVMLVEVVLALRTGYVVKETNSVVLDPKSIASNYLKLFFPDLISCIPFTYLNTQLVDGDSSVISGTVLIYMCCLFAFSFYRFHRMLFYFSTVPIMLNLSEKHATILTLTLRTISCWHWASCVRRIVPLYLQENDLRHVWEEEDLLASPFSYRRIDVIDEIEFESIQNILLNELAETFANYTVLNKYTRTMMITLKLVLQSGYGSETSDSIYNMLMTSFLMLGGWIYTTYVLILMSNVIMAAANAENKFIAMTRGIDAFCKHKKLSKALTKKIQMMYTHKYRRHYFNENAIKESTTASVRNEIMMHVCAGLISNVALFQGLPTALIEDIVQCLKLEIYFPNDTIIRSDTIGDAMYFMAYGTAGIYTANGMQLATIVDGSHFGEISLLIKGQVRIASVVALEMCEIYKLSQKDFRKILGSHEDLLREMKQTAADRINLIRKLEKFEADYGLN